MHNLFIRAVSYYGVNSAYDFCRFVLGRFRIAIGDLLDNTI